MRCPVLVGRDGELDSLLGLVAGARGGVGAAVFVIGEAGIGKSRLMRAMLDRARSDDVVVLLGRAVPSPSPAPFRPLSEALLSALRDVDVSASHELRPFRPALARLLPGWREVGAVDLENSAVVLGEGVVRLLRLLAPAGCLLVLEDLHWADPETLAVVEYLCDNVGAERIVIACSARPDGPADVGAVASALSARGTAALLPLLRLNDAAVAAMIDACPLSADLAERAVEVVAPAEGVPLLVEELLAGGADPTVPSHARVPATVAEMVRQRLSRLDHRTRRVLAIAALLGRRFDWAVLPIAAGITQEEVLGALRRAVDVQLVDAEGSGFRFRHALTRDGVIASLLPPERAALAAVTRRALEAVHPGLPDGSCVLAAELAEAAGESDDAAVLLVRAGRRALRQAALTTAERLLRRAQGLAGSDRIGQDAGDALVEVLATAGRVDDAVAVAAKLSAMPGNSADGGPDRGRVRLRLAQAAIAADRWEAAADQLEQARPSAAENPLLAAEFAALAAQVAIGRGDLDAAAQLARDAAGMAADAGQPEVQCEAWEIIGRCERPTSLAAAGESFERALHIAEAHGLVMWQLRALHELGTIDMLGAGDVQRLLAARHGAEQAGALTMTAVLDVQLAGGHHMRGELDQCLEAATRAVEAGRRLRADRVRRLGLCFAASAHAASLDRDRMEATAREALAQAGGDLDVTAAVWGDARGMFALLTEDRGGARRCLECAAELGRSNAAPLPSPWWGFRALLRAVDGGDAATALRESERVPQVRHIVALRGYATAVLLGRDGDARAAEQAFALAHAEAAVSPWWRRLGQRLVAEAAIRDGWGEPLVWLEDSADFFDRFPAPTVASACRSLRRRAGAPARRDAARAVAPGLADRGVTSREAEVLALVGQGLSNREMAERLYLSPRTVEKHVEHLARKLGARSRSQLVAYAATAPRTT